MRLSWKLFFITTPVFILFLTIFGSWMITESFNNSLDQERERCMVESQMFQNSYELTLGGLSEVQKESASMQEIVGSFYNGSGDGNTSTRIYDKDGEILYQDNGLLLETSIREQLDEVNNVGSELVEKDGETYVVVVARSIHGDLIETTRNITSIFDDRNQMYSVYQVGVLLLTVLVGGVILLVLFWVMRNMQKLSRATRQYARGQYDTSVDIRSRDEIGMLADDFNWMANAMNQQMQRLQNEVRRQEEFSAAFAHELKTPLTSIIGYADTIRQMELTQEETDMCADYIYNQGKRLQSLSYKLLEMTMAEQNEIMYREISVPEFFETIRRTVQPSLAKKQITLVLRVQDGVIYGDRDLLSSLFINLIDNAGKASENGRKITITGVNQPDGYSIAVADEGSGVAPEELARITEAFYMVDKSRSRREGGAGLGLALCEKIVRLHQAGWQFQSKPGCGMTVTVRFRIPEISKHERRRQRAEEKSRRSDRKRRKREKQAQ